MDINISKMKKYIGIKVVMAEPMTMTEAQKVLGRELKPATVEEDGYLVEYKDGYKSWSPKSVFEEAYREVNSVKGCDEYKEPLIKECDEVRELIEVINMLKEKINTLIHNSLC